MKELMEGLDALRKDANDIKGKLSDTAFPGVYLLRVSCVNTGVSLRGDGQLAFRVVFASAAPEEADFCRYVEKELLKRNWPNVTVVCEW